MFSVQQLIIIKEEGRGKLLEVIDMFMAQTLVMVS